MQCNMKQRRGAEGKLPAMAPLANPYVPFQLENPPVYEARKGIVRGTLFPGLDLPFMGMVNQNELPVTPKSELQVLGLAVQELALYLDTHPEDEEAFEALKTYIRMSMEGQRRYAEQYGPISFDDVRFGDTYTWVDAPWPWQHRKEG